MAIWDHYGTMVEFWAIVVHQTHMLFQLMMGSSRRDLSKGNHQITDGMLNDLAKLHRHHGRPDRSQKQGSNSQKANQKRKSQRKSPQFLDASKLPKRPSSYMVILLDVHRAGILNGMGGTRAIWTIPKYADKEFWRL